MLMKNPQWQFGSVAFIALFFSTTAMSAEPDFFIHFSPCKIVAGSLTLAKDPLRVVDGDPVKFSCIRENEKVFCRMLFEEGKQGHKGDTSEFKITLDIPPSLHFQLIEGEEYIAVDTSQHAAVLTSLVLGDSYAGSKICHGIYATSFELKNLRKQKK
jgi:hypothetical protein